jgi:maleylacetoacetate isomerase
MDLLAALAASGKRPLLYQFWRSSASWRVRWALLVKGIPFDVYTVDLLSGEHLAGAHRTRSPIGTVPALQLGDRFLTESVAIVELLEQLVPAPPLYPHDPWLRARVRQVVELINSEIQPLQAPSVRDEARGDQAGRAEWVRRFNQRGLAGVEQLLRTIDAEQGPGTFAVGGALTAADLFLVPQLEHARRFEVDLSAFPRLLAAERAALASEHGAAARPELQPGAPR